MCAAFASIAPDTRIHHGMLWTLMDYNVPARFSVYRSLKKKINNNLSRLMNAFAFGKISKTFLQMKVLITLIAHCTIVTVTIRLSIANKCNTQSLSLHSRMKSKRIILRQRRQLLLGSMTQKHAYLSPIRFESSESKNEIVFFFLAIVLLLVLFYSYK